MLKESSHLIRISSPKLWRSFPYAFLKNGSDENFHPTRTLHTYMLVATDYFSEVSCKVAFCNPLAVASSVMVPGSSSVCTMAVIMP